MGKASREKGKRGELEFSKLLIEHGIPARRGKQYSGNEGSPDVVSGLKRIRWEVKRTERLRVYPFLDQAMDEAGDLEAGVVAHRQSQKNWVAILDMGDFLEIAKLAFRVEELDGEA